MLSFEVNQGKNNKHKKPPCQTSLSKALGGKQAETKTHSP